MATLSSRYLSDLHRQVEQLFNLEEVRTLCFKLGVDFDNLTGEGKSSRIRELILQLARRDELQALVDLARRERPQAAWADVPPDFSLPGGLETAENEKPRLHFEPETVFIPAGTFRMGSAPAEGVPVHETPQFEVSMPAYRIGTRPVTNAEYYYYLRRVQRAAPPELRWELSTRPSPPQEKQPVSGLTWHEARAYCAWWAGQTGRAYALPSEAQWERAALEPGDPYAMVGGIREWTTTLWGEKRRAPDPRYAYPWRPDDGRDDPSANDGIRRVTRGASARPAQRHSELPGQRGLSDSRIGFRIVIDQEE